MQLVSGNLNTFGNTGQFETDPSTWGFTGFNGISHGRSNDFVFANLWACKSFYSGSSPSSVAEASLGRGLVAIVSGKKYVARVMVRMPSVNAIGLDAYVLSVKPIATVTYVANVVTTQTRTVAQAKAGWVELECTFDGVGVDPLIFPFGQDGVVQVFMEVSGGGNPQLQPFGAAYIDDFRIFEYVIPANPCTLAIDVPGTVVVNETSAPANNGSITVAITGGTAPFQYSRDGGATWQSSNQFTGLDAGTYNIVVREQNRISCSASQSFVVNTAAGGPTHSFTTQVVHESVAGANDGQITVTVSGTGGPFEFSRNGGTTWQTGNVFSGLAPATYSIVVRNAALQGVGQNVTVNAGAAAFEKVFWSRNPIVTTAAAQSGWNVLNNYRGFCDTRIEEVAGSSVFVSRLTQEQVPDATGGLRFNVQGAFQKILKAIPPTVNENTPRRLTDRIKLFKNFIGNLQDDLIVPPTTTASNPFLVLLGGLDKFTWRTNDFFSTLTTTRRFLTHAPVEKYVDTAQEDYLTFFVYAIGTTQLKLRARAFYDDNTDTTAILHTANGVQYGQLWQLPAGPNNCGVKTLQPAKNLLRYELSVLNQADALISEVRTYVLDVYSYPMKRFFMFLNSLGGFEVLRFYGQSETEEKYERQLVRKYLPDTYDAQAGEFENATVNGQSSYEFSSGYFEGQLALEWLRYMRDLLRTRQFYDVTNGARVPLIITNDALEGPADQNYENRFVRISCTEAYINENAPA